MHVFVIVLQLIGAVLVYPTLWFTLFVLWVLNGWPMWSMSIVIDLIVGTWNTFVALYFIRHGAYFPGALFAALAGLIFWTAYNTWRRNRPKGKRRFRGVARRIAVIAGRLRIVHAR